MVGEFTLTTGNGVTVNVALLLSLPTSFITVTE